MKIQVKREHIEKGIPSDRYQCPVCLALVDAGLIPVVVEEDHIVYDGETYNLPLIAQEFIKNFDEGNPVPEIEFEIKLDGSNL